MVMRRFLLAAAAFSGLAACGAPSYNSSVYAPVRYSNPLDDLRQESTSKAESDAEAARSAIAAGSKTRLTIADAEGNLRQMMKDPESVRFRDVHANRATGAVCGYYNAKNSYGGYVGESPFIYYHSPSYPAPQMLFGNDIAATTTSPYVVAFCPPDKTTVSADAPAKVHRQN
jgi:hypothetical protein